MIFIMVKKSKSPKKKYQELESVLKGIANRRRIELMEFIAKKPELSGEEIAERLDYNYQTCSDHLRKLVKSDLVGTYREGNRTLHVLTETGESLLAFINKL